MKEASKVVYRSNLLFVILTLGIVFLATVFTAIFLVLFVILIFVIIIAFNVLKSVVIFEVRQGFYFRLESSICESLDKVL